MNPPSWQTTLLLASILAATLSVSGCENTIDPFSEEATYSVYGALDADDQRQFIRVKPLHAPLSGARTFRSLDADVTLHNVTDGTSERLADSVVVFGEDNQEVATHNYWTDTPITPSTKYRLVIEDPDGTTVEATTTTPPVKKPNASPERGHCQTRFYVDFPGIKRAERIISVTIRFETVDSPLEFVIHEDIYNADHGRPDNAFIVFDAAHFLSDEYRFPEQDRHTDHCETICQNLTSGLITVRYTYAGNDWEGTLPERLTDPIESPTVINGSGYFGAVARNETTIPVNTDSIPSDHPMCQ